MYILIGLLVGILVDLVVYAIAVPAKDENGKRSIKKVIKAHLIALALGLAAMEIVFMVMG